MHGTTTRCPTFHLSAFRSILPPQEFSRAARLCGCVPRRRRILVPQTVCWLMMYVALHTSSMTQGLVLAWGELVSAGLTRRRAVSEEAFCQARGALPLRFFRMLWARLINRYQQRHDPAMRWKGRWRVLAADSTVITLPRSPRLVAFFGAPANARGSSERAQARLTALCSVFTGFCLGFVCSPLRFGEPVAVRHLLRRVRRHDLVLLDRNFFSYAILMMLSRRGACVLMRLQARYARCCRLVRRLGPDDQIVTLHPEKLARRKTPGLPKTLTLRLIRYQRPGFRVSWLLTSINDPREASARELVDLYHRRWAIETIYREWKHTLDLQNVRSATPHGVLKEIHAHVMLHDLIRWVMTDAAGQCAIAPVGLSFTTTLSLVRSCVGAMLGVGGPRRARALDHLLRAVRAAPIRHRPGRSFPRRYDHKPRDKGRGKRRRPDRIRCHA